MTTKLKTWIWAGMLSCTAFQSASAQSVIFQDDFENGPAAWTFQNAWHLTGSVCGSGPTSGSTMARFGNPNQCGFNGAGRLITAAAIDLPADAQAARLRYESWEDTECGGGNCGWDHRFVYVSDDGGATWDEVEDGGAELKWIEKSIDLSGYLGQSVLIAFEFDDIDPLWNGTGGWMLDDVKVEVDEPGGPTIYCSPKLNSQGCGPLMSYSGDPSLSGADDLVLATTNLRNNVYGSFAWSTGVNNTPFQGGTLCVQIPARRTTTVSTGGSAAPKLDCSGSYSWLFSHAYLIENSIDPGETVHCQFFGRDVGSGAPMTLSNAVAVTILP